MDGLFQATPNFTPGYVSEHGRGYIIGLRAATLETIPPNQINYLMAVAASYITRKLPEYFPGRDLRVVKDGPVYKIVGDFSLGEV
jgi:hypothetical protein